MPMETIETPRLLLRPLTPAIYCQVIDNYTEAEQMAFFGFTKPEELEAERKRRQQGASAFVASFLYFHILDKETQKVIGSAGYYRYYPNHHRGEIGYVINEERYRQRGLIKEALPYIIKFGFETMGLHRIEAMVEPSNTPSLRIMELFGFTREGQLREHYLYNGVYQDSLVFSLLRKEWQPLNS